MAKRKVSEYTAKKLLYKNLPLPYRGLELDFVKDNLDKLGELDAKQTYVLKVDQGIKKRMKNGLVSLNKSPKELLPEIEKLQKKGYTQFIIEPFLPHPQTSEKYLSIERTRNGMQILYSEKGGIDIEENQKSIKKNVIDEFDGEEVVEIANALGLKRLILENILTAFGENYFSFLEINPLVVLDKEFYFLDIAAEVDSAAEFFIHDGWTSDSFRSGDLKEKTEEETTTAILSQKSQASFALNVLDPNGSVWMLLSGGGASIVLADEVYNLGYSKELANYGEYSGNPNAEEVYLYTKNILQMLLKSKAKQKVLIIAGGVANFTDVRTTFKGVVRAIDEVSKDLQKQKVKVFVRRGGPHQEEGLATMKAFLEKNQLLGFVGNQKTALPEIIEKAISSLSF